ncbi:hypothetical protein KY290_027586 [Solanum tuberosum]|uniref:Uncharacterized protein n=1 Tax=Solanum tuberosum TaxID=4113 RepID=A0ABQ7UG03_SOLTU|nr:hypothetical protein KY289_026776 [Solanum tuberosum]KAH0665326.1 hypothetical protein KY285_026532 [Solanum tuberosum]KAH0748354.1 hypothetical protein KY290_027586 [Solanum tuberosum]
MERKEKRTCHTDDQGITWHRQNDIRGLLDDGMGVIAKVVRDSYIAGTANFYNFVHHRSQPWHRQSNN